MSGDLKKQEIQKLPKTQVFKKVFSISPFLALFLFLPLTGCIYKMPNDKRFSTLPNTNNPIVTREKKSYIPGRG